MKENYWLIGFVVAIFLGGYHLGLHYLADYFNSPYPKAFVTIGLILGYTLFIGLFGEKVY